MDWGTYTFKITVMGDECIHKLLDPKKQGKIIVISGD